MMMQKLILATLDDEQCKRANEMNAPDRAITHAVLCGQYGSFFGSRLKCRMRYEPWLYRFPLLFEGGLMVDNQAIEDFTHTDDLGDELYREHQRLEAEFVQTNKKLIAAVKKRWGNPPQAIAIRQALRLKLKKVF